MTTTRQPDLDSLYSVNPDGSRHAIHPAAVAGRFQRRKAIVWVSLIVVYLVLPWIEVGGNPAVLIDIERRHFFFFGATFTPQDFWMAFFVVTGAAFSLFVLSALWGRVWCGWACPHTVFLEGVFRKIEVWIEGSARKRRALDAAPWRGRKLWSRLLKYSVYAVLASLLAHTLLSYFMPVDAVFGAMVRPPADNLTAFVFVVVLTLVMFVNFTWFREQLCIVVCPYGRLQGVLYDAHTVNVGYDEARGEPRGKLGADGAGHCIDCRRCVDVCPTGIDIRNGTQLECVGCANCIDACDAVMDHIGRPRGLVRYDSLAGFTGEARRFVRPRFWFYAVLMLLGIVVFGLSAVRRTSFEAQLLRASQTPFTVEGETLQNVLEVYLQNKRSSARTLQIEVEAPPGVEILLPIDDVELGPLADRQIPFFARLARVDFRPGLVVRVRVRDGDEEQSSSTTLLGPLRRQQP